MECRGDGPVGLNDALKGARAALDLVGRATHQHVPARRSSEEVRDAPSHDATAEVRHWRVGPAIAGDAHVSWVFTSVPRHTGGATVQDMPAVLVRDKHRQAS